MELTKIEFKTQNLVVEMEQNNDCSYSISISKVKDPDGEYEKAFCDFRTDEISTDEIIEVLTFAKNYNFIQEK
jgi:hypothetical protein